MLDVSEVMRCVLGTLYPGSCGGWALFARGIGCVGGVEGMRRVLLHMLEVIRCVLLCVPDAMEGEPYLLELLEAMRCVLLCIPEAVKGGFCLLEVLDVLEALEAIRCVLFCMLEAVEGRFCLLEVLELMRSVLH